MSGRIYYNEIDAFCCAWLKELMKTGQIADGEIDARDIKEVQPDDLRGFTQCHFFAGIGVWSYALKQAGWPDDLAVWTGSCPCQSFSASGKRGGFDDPRHLWPAWFRLIRELRPGVIFGEQVASRDGLAWLDVVCADLEGADYAVGATDLCAAGFGAPHIRQRLYFVAESASVRFSALREVGYGHEQGDGGTHDPRSKRRAASEFTGKGQTGDMADAAGSRRQGTGEHRGRPSSLPARPEQCGGDGELAKSRLKSPGRGLCGSGKSTAENPVESPDESQRAGFTNGFWQDAEWLWCRDQKYRPVEPGTFPLVTGTPNRVGRLRGYGNALCAPVAQAFVEAYLEIANNLGSA